MLACALQNMKQLCGLPRAVTLLITKNSVQSTLLYREREALLDSLEVVVGVSNRIFEDQFPDSSKFDDRKVGDCFPCQRSTVVSSALQFRFVNPPLNYMARHQHLILPDSSPKISSLARSFCLPTLPFREWRCSRQAFLLCHCKSDQ